MPFAPRSSAVALRPSRSPLGPRPRHAFASRLSPLADRRSPIAHRPSRFAFRRRARPSPPRHLPSPLAPGPWPLARGPCPSRSAEGRLWSGRRHLALLVRPYRGDAGDLRAAARRAPRLQRCRCGALSRARLRRRLQSLGRGLASACRREQAVGGVCGAARSASRMIRARDGVGGYVAMGSESRGDGVGSSGLNRTQPLAWLPTVGASRTPTNSHPPRGRPAPQLSPHSCSLGSRLPRVGSSVRYRATAAGRPPEPPFWPGCGG